MANKSKLIAKATLMIIILLVPPTPHIDEKGGYASKIDNLARPRRIDYTVINSPSNFKGFLVSLSELELIDKEPCDSRYLLDFDTEYMVVDLVGGYLIYMPHTKYYAVPGAPYVAVREVVVNVGGKIVEDVYVLNGNAKSVVLPDIAKAPPPIPLYPANLSIPSYDEIDEGFFPSSIILSWHQKGNKLYMSIASTVYDMSSNRVYLIENLELGIKYGLKPKVRTRGLPQEIADSQYIIITSEALAKNLTRLVDLHSDLNPVIVNTSWIYRNYQPAENPPVTGFSDSSLPMWSEINKTYNYTLALRIISFLRELTDKQRYVVLVGDAEIVPPSYYYWDEQFYEDYEDFSFDAWVPTDYFYISPDYDFSADLYVARIPVDTPNSLKHTLTSYGGGKAH